MARWWRKKDEEQSVGKEPSAGEPQNSCPNCNSQQFEILLDGKARCISCNTTFSLTGEIPVTSSTSFSPPEESPSNSESRTTSSTRQFSEPSFNPPSTPTISISSTDLPYKRIESIENTIEILTSRMEKIVTTQEEFKKELTEVKETLTKIDATIHELTVLYDAISAQYNPFIDLTTKKKEEVPEDKTEPAGEESSSQKTGLCKKCSKPIPPEALVCPACGTPAGPAGEEPAPEKAGPEIYLPSGDSSEPILARIKNDYRSSLLTMRWIEFLLDKVDISQLPSLLEYYRRINWIGPDVKSEILWRIRGVKYIQKVPETKKVPDAWRLTIDDHLKTLLYLELMRGGDIDRRKIEELEANIVKLKQEGFYEFER